MKEVKVEYTELKDVEIVKVGIIKEGRIESLEMRFKIVGDKLKLENKKMG